MEDHSSDEDWAQSHSAHHQACFEKRCSEIEFGRLLNTHRKAGYRQGLLTAQDHSLQHSFDRGFAVGAQLGRQLGLLRGRASSLLQLSLLSLNQRSPPPPKLSDETVSCAGEGGTVGPDGEVTSDRLRGLIRTLNQLDPNSTRSPKHPTFQSLLDSYEAEIDEIMALMGICLQPA